VTRVMTDFYTSQVEQGAPDSAAVKLWTALSHRTILKVCAEPLHSLCSHPSLSLYLFPHVHTAPPSLFTRFTPR